MPASLAVEEKALAVLLEKTTWTATKSYIGLSTFKPAELTKKTKAKEFGEHEPTEANSWARIEVDTIVWEKTKAEGETGATKWVNSTAITFKKLTGGEYLLETFALLPTAKQTEDAAEPILVYGKLTTKVTINSATTEFTVPAKGLEIEAE